jgi:zinc transporter, ZIP family
MEAGSALAPGRLARRMPAWAVGLLPLVVLGLLIALFVALDAPGLDRRGVPLEELVVDRTVLSPGEIELHVRNDGPDPVEVEQVTVNDGFAAFSQGDSTVGRLGSGVIRVEYPWIEGESYEVGLLTATGGTIGTSIDVATETPDADVGFYGLMALIGLYVGVIPVAIGMLWLPWVRRIDRRWVQFLLALTIGLLAWLGIDALLEGVEIAGAGAQAFGGPALVFLGVVAAYLALAGVDAFLRGRGRQPDDAAADPTGPTDTEPRSEPPDPERRRAAPTSPTGAFQLALLVALGVGLHNLGEGLAIGSAYAVGSLALGATLVVGFALHNTTEGLAIVAPVADERAAPARRLPRLALLGLIAGAPAILGAWIGASAFDTSVAAFMFGLGAGAIAQVVVQIAPSIRDTAGRLLHPLAVGGLLAGLALMYSTGLLISL